MDMKEVCRACLCTSGTMCNLLESILPTIDSPPNSVVDLWKIFIKMLMSSEGSFPDKICVECLDEIQRTYSFMLKCARSDGILKKMKNDKVSSNELKTVSVLEEYHSSKTIKSENDIYPNISQIKTENIEWNDGENKNDEGNSDSGQFEEIIYTNFDSRLDPQSQHTLIVQHEDNKLGIELLDHLNCEDKVTTGEVSCTQDLKQEPELDIWMESDEFADSEDKSSSEILQCPACRYECKMEESLEIHINESHITGKTCRLCNKEFECTAIEHLSTSTHLDANSTTDGVLESTNKKLHECKVCGKNFMSESHLKRHFIIHTGERPFKCEICPKAFGRKGNLTEHLKCHTDERPFKCEICPKTFSRERSLKKHLKCHTEERPFECEICPKSFKQKVTLTNHLKCHTGERPFKCEICLKTFTRKCYLTYHLKCHTGESPFKCEICLKTFGLKGNLTEHLKRHTGEKPFKCEICTKTFGQKSTLTSHLNRHTGERTFKCEICPRAYRQQSSLSNHLKSHTGRRPFKCEVCHKTFVLKRYLKLHLRCHAGERIFKCKICPETFGLKSNLKAHLICHTGDRPFKCEICQKTFKSKIILKRHLKRHTENNESQNLHDQK